MKHLLKTTTMTNLILFSTAMLPRRWWPQPWPRLPRSTAQSHVTQALVLCRPRPAGVPRTSPRGPWTHPTQTSKKPQDWEMKGQILPHWSDPTAGLGNSPLGPNNSHGRLTSFSRMLCNICAIIHWKMFSWYQMPEHRMKATYEHFHAWWLEIA